MEENDAVATFPRSRRRVERRRNASAGSPPQDVGSGIRVATVRDPFGNAFGIIENPHFSAANVR